jgi:hydrogenase nickel incorporation protein HypB
MCDTCGCSDGDVTDGVRMVDFPAGHGHGHGHTVLLEQKVLARNDDLAVRNREWLGEREIHAVNLMSSPGSGKTTLLERTIRALTGEVGLSVVEGDQETLFDAERIRATGARVIQVNTGAGCHLDANMVATALRRLDPAFGSVVFVENVGNLVCPALFDLGEHSRVVVVSVTEGADKPVKYPHMFRTADVVLLNKVDLLPYVDFDLTRFTESVGLVQPRAEIIHLSATRGDGIEDWYGWLRARHGRSVLSS